MLWVISLLCSGTFSPTDDIEDYDYNGDNQKHMDESAHRVRTDKAKKPEHNKNNSNCVKHKSYPFRMVVFEQFALCKYSFLHEQFRPLMESGTFRSTTLFQNTEFDAPVVCTAVFSVIIIDRFCLTFTRYRHAPGGDAFLDHPVFH